MIPTTCYFRFANKNVTQLKIMGVLSDFESFMLSTTRRPMPVLKPENSAFDLQVKDADLQPIVQNSPYVARDVSAGLSGSKMCSRFVLYRGCELVIVGVDDSVEVKQVASIVWTFLSFVNRDKSLPVKIKIYYAPLVTARKGIDGVNVHGLGCDDVNSGVTLFSNQHPIVLVYRREEASKVLIHELVHATRMDSIMHNISDIDQIGKDLAKSIGLVSDVPVRLAETYTELLASFFDLMICDPIGWRKNLPAMRRHFLSRAEMILCLFYSQRIGMRQRTHAFEYYVAKASLFAHQSASHVFSLIDRGSPEEIMFAIVRDSKAYVDSHFCSLSMAI